MDPWFFAGVAVVSVVVVVWWVALGTGVRSMRYDKERSFDRARSGLRPFYNIRMTESGGLALDGGLELDTSEYQDSEKRPNFVGLRALVRFHTPFRVTVPTPGRVGKLEINPPEDDAAAAGIVGSLRLTDPIVHSLDERSLYVLNPASGKRLRLDFASPPPAAGLPENLPVSDSLSVLCDSETLPVASFAGMTITRRGWNLDISRTFSQS